MHIKILTKCDWFMIDDWPIDNDSCRFTRSWYIMIPSPTLEHAKVVAVLSELQQPEEGLELTPRHKARRHRPWITTSCLHRFWIQVIRVLFINSSSLRWSQPWQAPKLLLCFYQVYMEELDRAWHNFLWSSPTSLVSFGMRWKDLH